MKKKVRLKSFGLIALVMLLVSCGEESFVPKPKAYHKLEFPQKSYVKYESETCPFVFHYPDYAKITTDTAFLDTLPDNPCWLNVIMPDIQAQIYMSYKEITEEQDLAYLIEDAHFLTSKHTVKAEYIDEILLLNPQGVGGLIYEVGGDAASSLQFFLTDSVQHFIRASVYFRSVPNADSLKPAVDFVRSDVDELIRTFDWVD